jgi:hypothetical protein
MNLILTSWFSAYFNGTVVNPFEKNPPFDKLVSITIAYVFGDFYQKNQNRFVYIFVSRLTIAKTLDAEI